MKIVKCDLKNPCPRNGLNYSSNERAKKNLPENENFWGGGGRKWVKFHFEVLGNFSNLKMRGISLIS